MSRNTAYLAGDHRSLCVMMTSLVVWTSQVLLAVQRLVNVLGPHSPALNPLLLPLLQYATDPDQPEALQLVRGAEAHHRM